MIKVCVPKLMANKEMLDEKMKKYRNDFDAEIAKMDAEAKAEQ